MPQPAAPQCQHLTSRGLTGHARAEALHLFSEVTRVELQPGTHTAHPRPLDFAATVLPLGDEAIYAQTLHTPCHMLRSRVLAQQDGSDAVYLAASGPGGIVRAQHGDIDLPPDRFALISKARVHEGLRPWGGPSHCIQVPHAALARLVPGLEEAPMRLLPPGLAEPALAMGYARLLAATPGATAPVLRAALAHVLDLMARMLAPPARQHDVFVPAAGTDAVDVPRLALIRQDILARIDRADLSLAQIARLHQITPRQVQRLFARQGESFSGFVGAARLTRARGSLADPAQRHRRVVEIALDAGFDDVSAFSRAFRRQFGMSPGEARQEANGEEK